MKKDWSVGGNSIRDFVPTLEQIAQPTVQTIRAVPSNLVPMWDGKFGHKTQSGIRRSYVYISYRPERADICKIGRHSGADPQSRRTDYNLRHRLRLTQMKAWEFPAGCDVLAEGMIHRHFVRFKRNWNWAQEVFSVHPFAAMDYCAALATIVRACVAERGGEFYQKLKIEEQKQAKERAASRAQTHRPVYASSIDELHKRLTRSKKSSVTLKEPPDWLN